MVVTELGIALFVVILVLAWAGMCGIYDFYLTRFQQYIFALVLLVVEIMALWMYVIGGAA